MLLSSLVSGSGLQVSRRYGQKVYMPQILQKLFEIQMIEHQSMPVMIINLHTSSSKFNSTLVHTINPQ